jgi:hypothetical protein
MYNLGMVKRLVIGVVFALLVAGCTRSRDIERELSIVDVNSGWYDAGVVEGGMNKLVPSISLRLHNVSPSEISSVRMMAIFRRVDEEEAWGEHYIRAIGSEGLPGGETGEALVLRSERGYTSEQSRAQMLKNRDFVDARVEIFGRHGSRTWVRLGEYQIERQLLTE